MLNVQWMPSVVIYLFVSINSSVSELLGTDVMKLATDLVHFLFSTLLYLISFLDYIYELSSATGDTKHTKDLRS